MKISILSLLLLIGTATTGLSSDPDDRRVKEWIAASVSDTSDDVDAAIQKQRSVDGLEKGWRELKRCRDTGLSLDPNLAAAEHFMFMRFVASKNGDAGYARLPKWYETVKTAAVRTDLDRLIQTSNQPVSTPNPAVTVWGERGVTRGLEDYRSREGKEPRESGISLATVFGLTYYVYYYNATGAREVLNGSCTVFPPPRGTWVSTDAGHRWTLDFRGGELSWTERGPSATNTRVVKLREGGTPGVYKISRDNDVDVLTFLGFSPALRSAILGQSPHASYMILTINGTVLTSDWHGLLVIKNLQGQFKEMKQPEDNPAKNYTFTRN
jgi:hypothetical protein